MGFGFVLIAWMFLLVLVSLPLLGLAGLWAVWSAKRRGQPFRPRRFFQFCLVVPLVIGYLFLASLATALFNESVRGLDPGFGDAWQVAIANGYRLCMVDGTESGYLMRHGCSGSPLLSGIVRLGVAGEVVSGSRSDGTAFTLDMRNGALKSFAAWDSVPGRAGIVLQSTEDFYGSRRSRWADLFLLIALVLAPSAWLVRWWYRKTLRAD